MQIDMTPLLTGRVKSIDFSLSEDYEIKNDLAVLPADIAPTQPITVTGTIADNAGYLTLNAVITVNYTANCDRCLEEIAEICDIELHRIVALNDKFGKSASIANEVDADELIEARGETLDITSAVYEEISLNLPEYHLCSDECPGLCVKCGKKKDGSCTCEPDSKKEIDPRWEKLKKLLENDEEK